MAFKHKPFHLLVFFTYANALQDWVKTGLIGRELLIYKKMVDKGHQVTLLTYGDCTDLKFAGELGGIQVVPVFQYLKKSKNRWLNLIRSLMIPFHHRLKPVFRQADCFKTNQMFGSWIPVMAALLYSKPLVVRCGYEMLKNFIRDEKKKGRKVLKAIVGYIVEFIAYISATKIVISNISDRQFILKCFPVQKRKVEVIRNFIDTNLFRSIKVKKKDGQILYLGRIHPRKNIENLITGVGRAGFGLDIIGKADDQYFLRQLEKGKYKVTFLGTYENRMLPDIINRYDLVVLPSLYENNPKTLLEAMACEKIVLGTNVDGIKELIQDGKSGFLCETDAVSIQTAISNIFSHASQKEFREIGRTARAYVTDQCSLNKIYQKEMQIYSRILC